INPLEDINGDFNYIFRNYIARLAVPFFFVAGGYFCFRKTSYEKFDYKVPLSYAFRMLKMYFIWIGIYMVPILYSVSKNEKGFLRGLIGAAHTILLGNYSHLWYLYASAVAVILVTFSIWRNIKIEKIAAIGGILYIIGLLGDAYFGLLRPLSGTPVWAILKLYQKVFTTTRNGFFDGFLFVGIGALFAYKKIAIAKVTAVVGFAISMCLMLVEAFIVEYFDLAGDHNMYIFLVSAVFFLFYIVAHIEIEGNNLTRKLRTYSSLIYLSHQWINFPVLAVIEKVIEKIIGAEHYQMHSLLSFILVFAGALLTAIVITELQKCRGFK
ncbi:MAG: acyltransferase, partial [Clostridia bacterium]|nr:acyltransferase [Clostridia bacterium]